MERILRDGDYVPDGLGGFEQTSGEREALARGLFLLTARRGKFPFLPRMGSRLYQLGRERPSARQALAAQYVTEALAGERDLRVVSTEWAETGTGAELKVQLEWQGETLTATLEL